MCFNLVGQDVDNGFAIFFMLTANSTIIKNIRNR